MKVTVPEKVLMPAGSALPVVLAVPVVSARVADRRICAACHAPVELHQPDESTPGRLLGVCPDCRGWTLIRSLGRGRYSMTLIVDPE